MFANSGDNDAPCGEPSSHSVHCPSSTTPTVNHLSINRRTRSSAIRCRRNLRSQA
jgi:hypothetical protein